MKKPRNIPALIFAITFLAILLGRIGKADTIDIALYGLAVFSMLLFFAASNMNPKGDAKENPLRRGTLIIGAVAIAVIALIVSILLFNPVPIVSPPYTAANGGSGYSESDVALGAVHFNGEDVTDKIDWEEFVEILSRYECRRTFNNPFPYASADIVWQIDFVYKVKPVHIVLGKDSVRYEDAGDFTMYEIINADALIDELTVGMQ